MTFHLLLSVQHPAKSIKIFELNFLSCTETFWQHAASWHTGSERRERAKGTYRTLWCPG
ncbi:hypothetical protein PGIGA_G00001730 [Pangasianodon gigas]|uniref:Uncharacterized protein n=1 Tax=Pangasianodon gigas TaxID=30993 RepID=A0ACC5W4U7_PANGG|nr:hypothetical protein [Pangasianodon gigas]